MKNLTWNIVNISCNTNNQGPHFDDMSSFVPCEREDAIQYINLEYGAQAPKILIVKSNFSSCFVIFKF